MKNLEKKIVYHTQKDFKRDMWYLAGIIILGISIAVIGLISILMQFEPNL